MFVRKNSVDAFGNVIIPPKWTPVQEAYITGLMILRLAEEGFNCIPRPPAVDSKSSRRRGFFGGFARRLDSIIGDEDADDGRLEEEASFDVHQLQRELRLPYCDDLIGLVGDNVDVLEQNVTVPGEGKPSRASSVLAVTIFLHTIFSSTILFGLFNM